MDMWTGASILMPERPFSVRARDEKRSGQLLPGVQQLPCLHVLVQNSKESKNYTFILGLQVVRKIVIKLGKKDIFYL